MINLNFILETLEPRPKQKHRRPEHRKHRIPPLGVFHLDCFRHYATFFEVFWIAPKGLPFICFEILQHNGCQKIPKDAPFTFFGTVTLFRNLIFNFFGNFLKSHFNFLHILQPTGVSQGPKGPPIYNFEH